MNSSSHSPRGWIEARNWLAGELRQRITPGVGESRRRHVDERLVQCIWFDRLLRSERLQTGSGKSLEILDPGRWNTAAGPDFLGASVRMAGEERRGDVEIHVESSDWTAHAHHVDPAYQQCILHAYLYAGDDRPYDTLADGRRLERLELAPALEPDLDTLRRTLHPEEYPYGRPSIRGLCSPILAAMDDEGVTRILNLAGGERLEARIRRLADQARGESLDQVFYQAFMTAQGLKASKTLYFLLSKRVRLEELFDYTHDVEPSRKPIAMTALLLYVAGLMHDPPDGEEDEETTVFRRALDEAWRRVAPYFTDRMIPPSRRWWKGTRPANFPPRRLAGIARILCRLDIGKGRGAVRCLVDRLRGLADCPPESPREIREAINSLSAELAVEDTDDYWAHRFTLGGKRTSRPVALIGKDSARSLLFNVVLPTAILWARGAGDTRLENALQQFIARFPALAPNEVTSFMHKRIFSDEQRGDRLLRAELRRQGLFHLFSDCCNNYERDCSECLLLRVS